MYWKALALYSSFHYHWYMSLIDLGNLLVLAYVHMEDYTHLDDVMLSFKLALQSASHSASNTNNIADTWSYHADSLNHLLALKAYNAALWSLSQMASLNLNIYLQQCIIQTARDRFATKATWFAIRKRHFDKAIEFLEGGQAIFWSQALHLCMSFDYLCNTNPKLA